MNRRIFIFTTHKTASVFLHKLGLDLAGILQCPKFSQNDRNFTLNADGPVADETTIAKPGIYGPLRYYISNLNLTPRDRVIVHLRDPRDVLVSLYYSNAYSHPVVQDGFNPGEAKREKWRRDGVDEFVRTRLRGGQLQRRYEQYLEAFGNDKRAVTLQYETMVTRFDVWLKKLLRHIDPALQQKHYGELFARHKREFAVPVSEDVWQHKRQILPGDHLRKLQQTTIENINEKFSDVMRRLSYRT